MNPAPDHPEFDFEHELPAGKEFFSLRYLARMWGCSEKNVQRLIDDGSLRVAVDLAPAESKHALPRVHRKALVEFLNDRKNLDKFAALRLAHREEPRRSLRRTLNARRQRKGARPDANNCTSPADPGRSLFSPLPRQADLSIHDETTRSKS